MVAASNRSASHRTARSAVTFAQRKNELILGLANPVPSLRMKRSNPEHWPRELDCFVASLLAATIQHQSIFPLETNSVFAKPAFPVCDAVRKIRKLPYTDRLRLLLINHLSPSSDAWTLTLRIPTARFAG
jgi:hypothetical protein